MIEHATTPDGEPPKKPVRQHFAEIYKGLTTFDPQDPYSEQVPPKVQLAAYTIVLGTVVACSGGLVLLACKLLSR